MLSRSLMCRTPPGAIAAKALACVLAALGLFGVVAMAPPSANAANQPATIERGDLNRGQPGAAFRTAEDVLAFINGYRDAKQPEKVPGLVHAMRRLGMLKDPEQAGIYIGFLAGFLSENQVNARDFVSRMFPLPPPAQVVIIKAIVYSGLPEWKALLGDFVERMPSRKVLLKRYLYQDGKTLDQLPLDSGAETIDTYWGFYFATGSYHPAQRIIQTLQWASDADDVEKLTIGSMAKWTLASNASRDKNLLDLAKAEMNHQPEAVRRELREIIEAAETFEISKIRRDALTAIEQLKVKGPQFQRDRLWWGQTGQTVLALGCVAASVLGQVQLGIPCVVGGAVSQAALNYFKPKPY